MSHSQREEDEISEIEGSSLFSDGDSEMIDSPADGYFSQRQHPRQIYVQNTVDSKDTESTTSRHETTNYTPTSSQPPIWASEQTPLLDAGPAPPDYYAATANRRAGFERTYQAYGSIEEEEVERQTPAVLLQAGLFGPRDPQSMSSTVQDGDHTVLKTTGHRSSRWRRVLMRCCNLWLILFVLLIAVILMTATFKHSSNEDDGIPTIPTPTLPVDQIPHIPHDTIPSHPASAGCSYRTFTESWHYDFSDLTDFSIEEAFTSQHNYDYNLGGSIWVRKAPPEQVPDIRVTANYITSEGISISNPKAAKSDESIKFELPQLESNSAGWRPCIDAAIIIDVKQGTEIRNWTVRTSSFNFFTSDPLFNDIGNQWLRVTGTTLLKTHSGKVNPSYWSSRETIIESGSGSVIGKIALRDLLSITTTSGAVAVHVEPKDGHQPAVLNIVTQSGSIQVDVNSTDLPDRDYQTSVESSSGSIAGEFVHGSKTSFKTRSGSIVPKLLPSNSRNATQLKTESTSGATSLRVLSPYDGGNLTNMHSIHDTSKGSGFLMLRYPKQWQGSFTGQSTSGVLLVHGPGVEIDWFHAVGTRRVSGRKGKGDSYIEISTSSGSADLGIGMDDNGRFFTGPL